ncbi:hypothetical protein [Planifilum fimeticola]
MFLVKIILWGLIAVIFYVLLDKIFIKGEYESDWKTEHGEYKVRIERVRTFRAPFMQAKITDSTRNKMFAKRIEDAELVRSFDGGKREEVAEELVRRYEARVLHSKAS